MTEHERLLSDRERMHEAVADVQPFGDDGVDEDGDAMPVAGVCTGWLLVAEWQGSDGHRWLTKLSGDATGGQGLPSWTERGFAFEVSNHWG